MVGAHFLSTSCILFLSVARLILQFADIELEVFLSSPRSVVGGFVVECNVVVG